MPRRLVLMMTAGCVAVLFTLSTAAKDCLGVSLPTAAALEHVGQPPAAYAGADRVVVAGETVEFWGAGVSPDDEIVEYSWDFDSDGTLDFVDPESGFTTHRFAQTGLYTCVLQVRDTQGRIARGCCRIIVVAEAVDRETEELMLHPVRRLVTNPPDGVTHRFAIMINGGSEARFWTDVELAYDMLVNGYGFAESDVYLLNGGGTDPDGENPCGMIDYPAYCDSLQFVFDQVALRSDSDDEVFIWITDHGRGYDGPLSEGGQYLGYMDGRASVDPGDEPDYLESDFKLRSIFTGGNYRCNHGLNVWKVCYRYSSPPVFYRNRYVSHFDSVYITSQDSVVSDHDIFIECFRDLAEGDLNRDGCIDTSAGEAFDYDEDGIPPYDPVTGEFDEDDWGEIDELFDGVNGTGGGLPEGAYPILLFDHDFEGRLCIDLSYDGGDPEIDGRDDDNAGLFDWMDVNQDGDLDDTVSVDEAVCMYSGPLYDDDIADMVDQLSVAKVTVVAEPCFSGGLVEDLTSTSRTINTATIEEAVSYGDGFIRDFVAALHGRDEYGSVVDADADSSGCISMLEAFNYAAARDYFDEIPQYDDNGDGLSHTDPVPAGGDGTLGSLTYLADPGTQTVATPVLEPGGGEFDSIVSVVITCADSLATIHYTVDGSDPGPSDPTYSGSLDVDRRTVLKARAYREGWLPSVIAEGVYILPGIRILYVRTDGSDLNDGLSWNTAKQTIGEALAVAMPGDDVWVKGDSANPYCAAVSAVEGVGVYGGFGGFEASASERASFPRPLNDPAATVIDAGGEGSAIVIPPGATAATLIDGLTLRNGRAIRGGGMFIDAGSPLVRNCTIIGNSASYEGGGVHCGDYSRPRIEDCLIAENVSESSGGGINIANGSNPTFVRCNVSGNSSGIWGGGFNCYSYSAPNEPVLVSCRIASNFAGQDGGGIYCRSCDMRVVNCTVTENTTNYRGGGLFCEWSSPAIENSVFWQDSTRYYGHEFCLMNSSNLSVAYGDVQQQGGSVYAESGSKVLWGDGCTDANPLFVDPDGLDDDPFTWADNDHQLSATSPCIDAGDNSAVLMWTTTDLAGQARFVDDPNTDPDRGHGIPPIVDMGAYELQVPAGVAEGEYLSGDPRLYQSSPNPFTSSTILRFYLPARQRVLIEIYNVQGQMVKTLLDAAGEPGTNQTHWEGNTNSGMRAAPGVYFCHMEAGSYRDTKKVVLLR
jgi:hypothetical protein